MLSFTMRIQKFNGKQPGQQQSPDFRGPGGKRTPGGEGGMRRDGGGGPGNNF